MPFPKVVIFAYNTLGYQCLKTLIHADVNICAVFTYFSEFQKDDPRTVAALAQHHAIPVYYDSPRNHLEHLAELEPDLMFSLYYRDILPKEVFLLARIGAFNMHGSLLPRFRGRCPVNWAILHGAEQTGATLHEIVERVDAGDIIDQQHVCIGPLDTAGLVQERVDHAGVMILQRQLPLLSNGTFTRKPQNLSQGEYYGRRTPADSQIIWSQSAWSVHNLIRALQPSPHYPCAFTSFGEIPFYCQRSAWPSVPIKEPVAPGTVIEHVNKHLVVACGDQQGLMLTRCSFEPDTLPDSQMNEETLRRLPVGSVLQ